MWEWEQFSVGVSGISFQRYVQYTQSITPSPEIAMPDKNHRYVALNSSSVRAPPSTPPSNL